MRFEKSGFWSYQRSFSRSRTTSPTRMSAGLESPSARARRGEARHDLERDARRGQILRLLRAAREEHGVAALQSHDTPARPGELDELRRDPCLGWVVLAAALSHVAQLRPLGAEGEQRG